MKKFSKDFKVKTSSRNIFDMILEKDTPIKNKNTKKTPASEFFSKIFESREVAHVFHLQLKNEQGTFAKHVALGEYYEKVVDILDELIEVYQGQYGIVSGYNIIDTESEVSGDIEEYFTETVEFIKVERYKMLSENDPHYQAIIDEIVNLLYRLIYKLKYLR